MSKTLTSFSDELAGLVRDSDEHVVRIEARRRLPASGVVWSKDGIILTANHIVRKDEGINIGLPDGGSVSAEVLGRDPSTDLAILKVDSKNINEPRWTEEGDLNVGNLVLALGRPGQSLMATFGVLSAVGDRWRTPGGGWLEQYVQTDVVMYPGFSGGPLVDARGHFVGVNTSGLLRGVSMTISRSTLELVVPSLLKHGRIQRGYLGVSLQPVQLQKKAPELGDQETGLLVVSVEDQSPADVGGVVQGDVIVKVNDQSTRLIDDLMVSLSGDLIGEKVLLNIIRGGEITEVELVLGER
ncbi:MAG: S1C family serine protease [Anaerolineales bacterium]